MLANPLAARRDLGESSRAVVSARPTRVQREGWLDLGRLLWIFGIVLFHFARELGGVLGMASRVGGQGVFFFLFASGYGLARSSTASLPYGAFLQRRVFKVMAPYWTLAAVFFALSIPLGFGKPSLMDVFIAAFGLVGMLPNHVPGAWWFIGGILQCYLVFPLLLRGAAKPAWLLGIVAALFFARGIAAFALIPADRFDPTYRLLPGVLPAFALGVVAGASAFDVRRYFLRPSVIVTTLLLEAAGALVTLKVPAFKNCNDLFFIPFAIGLPIWVSEGVGRLRDGRPLRLSWAPTWTMAVFLTHEWSLPRLEPLHRSHPWLALAIFLTCAVALGTLGAAFVARVCGRDFRAKAPVEPGVAAATEAGWRIGRRRIPLTPADETNSDNSDLKPPSSPETNGTAHLL